MFKLFEVMVFLNVFVIYLGFNMKFVIVWGMVTEERFSGGVIYEK